MFRLAKVAVPEKAKNVRERIDPRSALSGDLIPLKRNRLCPFKSPFAQRTLAFVPHPCGFFGADALFIDLFSSVKE